MPEPQQSNIVEITKSCTICGTHKFLSEFSKNPMGKYGLSSRCKVCINNKYREKNPLEDLEPRINEHGVRCSTCRIRKDAKFFHKDKKCNLGIGSRCKECSSIRAKIWNKENKFKNSPKRFNYHLGKKYKITKQIYDTILNVQGGMCAICKSSFQNKRNTCIDHCHTTGNVRGILCRKCNTGIGQFSDRIDLVESAAKYLKERLV